VITHELTTPDGRTLRVYEDGDPSGAPVLAQSGTPSAGLLYSLHVEDARRRGLRLLGYARPGYGGSSPFSGRSIADVVRDVEAIADELGLERLATWGISGGGPHALACAALLPERVVATASLASVAPYGVEGLDWLEGMGEANVKEFDAVLEGREALEPLLQRDASALLAADGDGLRREWEALLGPADREVMTTGGLVDHLLGSTQAGLRHGVDGWLDDNLAFVADWCFDVESITSPVLLLHGADDKFVPISHGEWLAARIPGVEARLTREDGHLTLYERGVAETHAWLLERL